MSSGDDSNSNPGSLDPYSILGLEPGASFELVQQAREKRLAEAGADPQAKAKIESSYDILLMGSLKERQMGKVSNAAANASLKEESSNKFGGSILTQLQTFSSSKSNEKVMSIMPNLVLPEGYGLTIRIALGLLSVVLLFLSPSESIDLILSLSTIGLFISQIRRGRRPISSLGWSVLFLSVGLIFGGIIFNLSAHQANFASYFSEDQLKALPAVILLWLGALLLS